MGLANRPATCTSCGKRLSRKQWYYRNGKYFCKKRCWVTEAEKAAKEAAKETTAKGAEAKDTTEAKAETATAKKPEQEQSKAAKESPASS